MPVSMQDKAECAKMKTLKEFGIQLRRWKMFTIYYHTEHIKC